MGKAPTIHDSSSEDFLRAAMTYQGSVTRRFITCGNPTCACQNDPHARHGPYTYWSTKKAGKTISRKLPPAEDELLTKWVENRRDLKEITDQMMKLAKEALPLALKKEAEKRDGKS